ncbi:MAG: ABC transporter ATP-binding protein [Solirubrobacterales bacterium]|nr:ABC transporter ATP-binding protein [Solirubrobacterales bacterium]OJU94279.1 MAG: ABC transporter [Solirubrobacterales bacterium 67-14]
MTEVAIEVKDLSKKYGEGVQALDGISFEVETGTVFGLLGPNGAGKSTTVKILTTLSHPTSGTASIMGYDVLEHAAEVRRTIGVVAQSSTADREATARENLRLQGQLYRMKGRELEKRIDSLLDSFKLSGDGDRIVRGFSGGMERRLTVAMALVHNPRVLFLDEPTTGLDPEVRSEMWEEISALAADEGTTILLTTHYLEEADMLARNLAIVDQGRIVAEGTPDGLKKELKGDAIQVGLGETREQTEIETALREVNGVSEVILNERTLHARAEDGARSVPSILAALDSAGITADTVTVARPSLDDVYLKYAGRTMEQAEKKQTEEVAA